MLNNTKPILKELPAFPTQPAPYPTKLITHTLLKDGTHILIRPIHPEEAPQLKAFFDKLSSRSRFLRFLSRKAEVLPKFAGIMTEVDYHQKMAFIATIRQGDEEIIVGEARYLPMLNAAENEVEFAITVADEYQHLGLGSALMWWLITYARQESIETFVGLVHASNSRMLSFMRHLGLPVTVNWDNGAYEVRLTLTPALEKIPAPLSPLLA